MMRTRLLVAGAFALLLFVTAVGLTGRAQGPARRTWEYKVAVAQYGAIPASLSEQELNRLGAEGWELVGTRSVESQQGASRQYRTDYFFKRLR